MLEQVATCGQRSALIPQARERGRLARVAVGGHSGRRQYSSGNEIVVMLRSASVMIQIFSPVLNV
jgi:hypothetical protein